MAQLSQQQLLLKTLQKFRQGLSTSEYQDAGANQTHS